VAVVGAGLVGPLLAAQLARRGYRVRVYERDPDPRQRRVRMGASINLTLSARGMAALDDIGVGDEVRARAAAAVARVVHLDDGRLHRLPYGESGEALLSVNRAALQELLITHAERRFSVPFAFDHACLDLNPRIPELTFATQPGRTVRRRPRHVVAADGAFSAVRQRLQRGYGFDYSQSYSRLAYTQIDVPAGESGWRTIRDALHLWPRGDAMLLAIPNRDGSFTATLLLPLEGPRSHAELRHDRDLVALFSDLFPDALECVPALGRNYRAHRPVPMVTIRCAPWSHSGRVLLVGDAAHAIFPSYGQGANAGLEDGRLLAECLAANDDDWPAAASDFERRRRPHTDAIAELSHRHLDDLRATMGTTDFLVRHRVERRLARLYPSAFRPLHAAISFTTTPYREAIARDAAWSPVVNRLCELLAGGGLADEALADDDIRSAVRAAGLAAGERVADPVPQPAGV
jgi:kynurenine 3-monooxygenase